MKLKVETYIFRSTRFETIQLYLAHFSDAAYITSLSLFGIELSKTNFDYLLGLINTRMPNLTTLSTDMLQGKYVDELTSASGDSMRLLELIFARLTHIYLWDCDAHIYEAAMLVGGGGGSGSGGGDVCDCGVKLKRRQCFSSYDYSFGWLDFSRLFNTEERRLSLHKAQKIVILFAQMCFCDAREVKTATDCAINVLRLCQAKSASHVELRFKCTDCNKHFVKYFKNIFGQ